MRYVLASLFLLAGCSDHKESVDQGSSAPGDSSATVNDGASATDGGSATDAALSLDGPPRFAVEMVMEEELAPFASWGNAQTQYGAKGDGTTDDTAALQKGLDDITSGALQVLYVPAGTYKITATLNIVGGPTSGAGNFGNGGAAVIGADPATTTIKWAGPSDDAMLVQNGGEGYRYRRITWDGGGTAGYGFAEWWDTTKGTFYGGSTEFEDEVFQNVNIGIMAGREGANYGQLDSEGLVRRVKFINNTFAGLDTGSFNALDWWVFESQFIDCARGVSNNYTLTDSGTSNGAGAMYVYRSYFKGSTVADMDLGNTGWFSLHDNVSIGSAKFIQTAAQGDNTEPLIVENNVVAQPTTDTPISFGAAGALMLVDNQIAASKAPYTITDFTTDGDVIALGNAFTSAIPAATGTQRIVASGNTTVASVNGVAPTLPSTPAVVTHAIFEVPSGATAAQIQTLIGMAEQSSDSLPIVHFGKGTWNIDTTLKVAANSHVQLVGDGWQSTLNWTGSSGPILSIAGPARVTVREMNWQSSGLAIAMTGMDVAGGRIEIVNTSGNSVSATHLERTQLQLQGNPYVWSLTLDDVLDAVSVGAGPFGVVTMTNQSSYVMVDQWWEGLGIAGSFFNIADGTFTYLGGHFSPASHGGTQSVVPLLVNGSDATASWIGMQLDMTNVPNGLGVEVENDKPDQQTYFVSLSSFPNQHNWFSQTGSGGDIGFMLNRTNEGQYANAGDSSTAAMESAWSQARSLGWDKAPTTPNGVDVRVYHMEIANTTGITIDGQ